MSTTLRVLYDRKSPRHNWQIYASIGGPEQEAWLMECAKKTAEKCKRIGWTEYEQGIATLEDCGQLPPTLPKSTKLVTIEKL